MSTYDIQTRVSHNQTIGAGALSESSIRIIGNDAPGPLTLSGRDIGSGTDLVFRIHVTEAFTGGGFTSLGVSVVVATDEALSTGAPFGITTLAITGMTLGNEMDVRIPSLSELNITGVAYLGLLYLPNGGVPATGKLSAWIPLGDSANKPRRLLANYTGPV